MIDRCRVYAVHTVQGWLSWAGFTRAPSSRKLGASRTTYTHALRDSLDSSDGFPPDLPTLPRPWHLVLLLCCA